MSKRNLVVTNNILDDVFKLQPLTLAVRIIMAGGLLAGLAGPARAGSPLPVPIDDPNAVHNNMGLRWVDNSSSADQHTSGTTMIINQHDHAVTYNWDSFNVAAGYKVQFIQPDGSAIALNKIYQGDASVIYGQITANGQVYLVNSNGFVFEKGSGVDAHTLVVSSLNITDEAFKNGIVNNYDTTLKANKVGSAALDGSTGGPELQVKPNAIIQVKGGAKIKTDDNGYVLLAAPSVSNAGEIIAGKHGQVILVASNDKVYLQPATQGSPFAGMLVEVGRGGNVSNNATGNIHVQEGNVTLEGFAVNQSGRISSTTSVSVNGSVRLLAREGVNTSSPTLTGLQTVRNAGTPNQQKSSVTIGETGSIEISPDTSDGLAYDSQVQKPSYVEAVANVVDMKSGSSIVAHSGQVDFKGVDNNGLQNIQTNTPSQSGRIVLEKNSTIDVSGLKNVSKTMSSNVLDVSVQSFNLRDAPYQRNGFLYGKTLQVDARDLPSIIDASGAANAVQRGIAERLTAGGSVKLTATRDVIVNQNAIIDISGGSLAFQGGYLNTTQLVDSYGRVVDIANADANQKYVGILGQVTESDSKWGHSQTFSEFGSFGVSGHYEQGYTEGKAGGNLNVLSPLLAWQGQLQAGTVNGFYQRNAPASGGSFTVNAGVENNANFTQVYNQEVLFQAQAQILNQNLNMDADTVLPANTPLVMNNDLVNHSGISNLSITTAGRLSIGQDAAISLPAYGNLRLTAPNITDAGSIHIGGGNAAIGSNPNANGITLHAVQVAGQNNSGNISLASTALLDVSGRWVNDFVDGMQGSSAIDAGYVKIAADGVASFQAGSQIKADGGASLSFNGAQIADGKAGSILLSGGTSTINGNLQHLENLHLSALGLKQGGSLTLEANAITVGSSTNNPSALNLALTDGTLAIAEHGGFKSINLKANQGDLNIADNAVLSVKAENRILTGDFRTLSGANSIAGFSQLLTLPENLRSAVNLSLSGNTVALGVGSEINLEKNSTLNINATNQGKGIDVEGNINALAGNVNLKFAVAQAGLDYNAAAASQAIWIGKDAHLDLQGTTILNPANGVGQVTGSVLNGGNLNIQANRGYVVFERGSSVNISGASAELSLPVANNSGQIAKQTVGSNAGSISITAAEGIIQGGDFSARAGSASNGAGTLNVALDRNNRVEEQNSHFSRNALQINVVQDNSAQIDNFVASGAKFGVTALDGLQASGQSMHLNGQATLGANQIASAGFDNVHLSVPYQKQGVDVQAQPPGEILFHGNVDLAAASSIYLDAPIIGRVGSDGLASSAGDVSINTSFLEIGSSTLDKVSTVPVSGGGSLATNSGWTQMDGAAVMTGFKAITLKSRHDFRTLGVYNPVSGNQAGGMLNTAADVTLQASQIYPTTLSQYTIQLAGDNAKLTLLGSAGDANPVTPLSAAGQLTFKAANIEQNGIIRAPLGSLEFDAAKSLNFGGSSVTSVSAAGVTIPFGETSNGVWRYATHNLANDYLVFNTAPGYLPLGEKHLILKSPSLEFKAGSSIDVSGGGDVQAATFQAGLGGSSDYLLSVSKAGGFAILPGLGSALAPYDQNLSKNFNFDPRANVYLNATGSLAAGYYTMLPTYYALLPGAYLVTPQANTRDQVSTSYTAAGVPIVSGYEAVAGTTIRDARTSGFLVETSAQAQLHAQYDKRYASGFFNGNAVQPVLPQDNGQVLIDASQNNGQPARIDLSGLKLSAQGSGKGAKLDISANNIKVVQTLDTAIPNDTLELTAQQLDNLHADSLLLGGTRQFNNATGITQLTATASNVSFAQGVNLRLPDFQAVAKDRIQVAGGAVLNGANYTDAASGQVKPVKTGVTELSLAGDSALLRVSADEQVTVSRSSSATLKLNSVAGLHIGDYFESADFAGHTRITGIDAQNNIITLSGLPNALLGLHESITPYRGGVSSAVIADASLHQTSIGVNDVNGFRVGDYVEGNGLAANTKITAIDNATNTLTLSQPTSGVVSKFAIIQDVQPLAGNYQLAATALAGTLNIDSGATLAAAKSMLLDASLSTVLDGTVNMQGGSLSLTGNQINIGQFNSADHPNALNLSNDNLQHLKVDDLLLNSRNTVNFYGNVGQLDTDGNLIAPLALKNLSINSFGLSGFDNAGKTVSVRAANSFTLENSWRGSTDAAVGTGSGVLAISAGQFVQGAGKERVDGFSATNISVDHQFKAIADSQLNLNGDLYLTAAAYTATGGHQFSIDNAGHAVELRGHADGVNYKSGEFGGSISVTADSIGLYGATVLLPSGTLNLNAQGDIVVDKAKDGSSSPAELNLAGQAVNFAGKAAYTPGGSFIAGSANGKILMTADSKLDIRSGGNGAAGGLLHLSAARQAVELHGNMQTAGAAESVDVSGFSPDQNFDQLAGQLMKSGAADSFYFRARDEDIVQAQTITARTITLVADKGSVDVSGKLDARGDKQGGEIELDAGSRLSVGAAAQLLASASLNGGKISLASDDTQVSATSGISLLAGSRLDVSGGNAGIGGVVSLRALQTGSVNQVGVNIQPVAGTVIGASRFEAVAVKKYSNSDLGGSGVLAGADGDPQSAIGKITADTQAYMDAAVAQDLAGGLAANLQLRPGVEIDYTGNLSLANDWDLANLRYAADQVPGDLQIRASGDLTINHSLTDGFNTDGSLRTDRSWSFQLVAGADLQSADHLATASGNNLNIGDAGLNPVAIRTGTGDIKLAAGGNVNLLNQYATVVTAGRTDINNPVGTSDNNYNPQLSGDYPIDGGELAIRSGGDINGATSSQFLTDWLVRETNGPFDPNNIDHFLTAWAVNTSLFQQNIGAFGGGKVAINAAGNINDLSVMMPTTGKSQGRVNDAGDAYTTNIPLVQGGGQMQVTAGGDITGGAYMLGKGTGSLNAGGQITGSAAGNNPYAFTAGPQIVLGGDQSDAVNGKADLSLNANHDIRVSAVSDAMILNVNDSPQFFTYAPDTRIAMNSLSGDVHLNSDTSVVQNILGINADTEQLLTTVYPASLDVAAFNGNIMLDRSLVLYPSATGNLNLLARQSIQSGNGLNSIILSDADPAVLPSASASVVGISDPNLISSAHIFNYENVVNSLDATTIGASADNQAIAALIHANTPVHSQDTQPVRLVALNGDINSIQMNLPKQAIIQAGRDILNNPIQIQQVNAGDNSIIAAGRDVVYTTSLDKNGNTLNQSVYKIEVAGPGNVLVESGRNLDMGTSNGLTTIGNILNNHLPASGAGLSLVVGLNGGNGAPGDGGFSPDYAGFYQYIQGLQQDYLQKNPLFSGLVAQAVGQTSEYYAGKLNDIKNVLTDYMRQKTGNDALSPADAFEAYRGLKAGDALAVQSRLGGILSNQVLAGLSKAGADAKTSALIDFIEKYLEGNSANAGALKYVDYAYKMSQINADFQDISVQAADGVILNKVFFNEIKLAGSAVADDKSASNQAAFTAIDKLFPAGNWQGDLKVTYSQIQTLSGGNINFLVPNGEINAGLAVAPSGAGAKTADQLGVVVQKQGDINAFVQKDFTVNSSRVFTLGGGDELVWSNAGNIDAGKGAKTALGISPSKFYYDNDSQFIFLPPTITSGSGFATVANAGPRGDIFLFAPHGFISSGDAGIAGGNIKFVTPVPIQGTGGVDAGGSSSGVAAPPAAPPPADASAASSQVAATQAAEESVTKDAGKEKTSMKNTVLGMLSVDLIGFGE